MSTDVHQTAAMGRTRDPIVSPFPVIRTGLATWDQRRLPADEFARRARSAEDVCRSAGVEALVVLAHASDPAPVTYLTNFRPTARIAAVILVPGRRPVLLAGMGGRREEAYQRSVAWIADLAPQPLSAGALRRILEDRGVTSGRLGITGLEDLFTPEARHRFVADWAGFDLVALDGELAGLRRRKGVRELAVLAEADGVAREAVRAGARAFATGRSAFVAAAAIEHVARARGCGDVRLLVGQPDGSLRPVEDAARGDGSELLVSHTAVEFRGYWAERAFTAPWSRLPPDRDLRPLVSAVSSRLGPGGPCVLPGQGDVQFEVRGLGLDIVELPDLGSGWEELQVGDAISVVASRLVGGRIVLHSATRLVTETGSAPLWHGP